MNRSGGETFGASYQVAVPAKLAGNRLRKQFATKADAEVFAQAQLETLRKHGQEFQSLTPAQRREVVASSFAVAQNY